MKAQGKLFRTSFYVVLAAALFALGAPAQADVETGLQGYWTFDDVDAPAEDSGPNALQATNNGV